MGATTNEFPLLNAAGLYVSETLGNGLSLQSPSIILLPSANHLFLADT